MFKYYVTFTYKSGLHLCAGYFFARRDHEIETPNEIEDLRVAAMGTLTGDFNPASIVILDWKRIS